MSHNSVVILYMYIAKANSYIYPPIS